MKKSFILKRKSLPLVVIEMMITSLLLSVWLCSKYHWDWVIGVLLFFGIILFTGALFFRVRLLRYIISIVFSLFWALLAYSIISGLTKSKVSPWLATGVVFVICLVLHKGYFYSERNATRIEYEER